MKRILYISLLLFAVTASVSVSCANVKHQTFTTGIENANATYEGFVDNSNGANIQSFTFEYYDYMKCETFTSDVLIQRCDDDEFYLRGYTAKLNKNSNDVFAPPKITKQYCDMPLKICWQ